VLLSCPDLYRDRPVVVEASGSGAAQAIQQLLLHEQARIRRHCVGAANRVQTSALVRHEQGVPALHKVADRKIAHLSDKALQGTLHLRVAQVRGHTSQRYHGHTQDEGAEFACVRPPDRHSPPGPKRLRGCHFGSRTKP